MTRQKETSNWYNVQPVATDVWAIREKTVASYLILGQKKALLLDTGWGFGDLTAVVKSLTDLPLLIICTHGHPDHVGGAFQFDKLYIAEADRPLLDFFYRPEERRRTLRNPGALNSNVFSWEEWLGSQFNQILYIQAGTELDLGGRVLKVLALPGHTPGSLCFLDETGGFLFSGDSIQAAPIWLHLESSLSLSTYLRSLEVFDAIRSKYQTILPAHGETPLNKEILTDLLQGVKDILTGKKVGSLVETYAGSGLKVELLKSSIVYNPNHL